MATRSSTDRKNPTVRKKATARPRPASRQATAKRAPAKKAAGRNVAAKGASARRTSAKRATARKPVSKRTLARTSSGRRASGTTRVPGAAIRRLRVVTRPKPVRAARPRVRLLALLGVMGFGFVAIGVRLVDLQAISASHYTELGLEQRVRTITLPAERGAIFDRNGDELAVSVPVKTIVADPSVVPDPAGYAEKLAPLLGVDERELRRRLADHNTEFAYVARQVGGERSAKVEALGLAGITAIPESKRFYPSSSLAAPVLGFVGVDGDGLGGLESGHEQALGGKAGFIALERDPQGRDIPNGKRRGDAAKRGNDLVLTLDQSLQYETEQALVAEVDRANAKGGTAVIVDVVSGDILAMATADGPSIDESGQDVPARPATNEEQNRALTDVFEPGSTNKVITLAAALEAGEVTPETTFDVPDTVHIGDKDFHDSHEHPTETMSVADIIRESSNVGTIMIGQQVGTARLDAAMRGFGFGSKTAVDFPGESPGLLPDQDTYRNSSTVMGTVPMGQGIAVTALQMLDVYTTLANDGVSRPPRLVAATIDSEGDRAEQRPQPGRRVVSSETAAKLRTMLAGAVADGTGTKGAIQGYTVAGKTGTAKKAPYDEGQYVASFVGFAPVEAPRFAAIVVVDAPGAGEIYGGDIAAPVFSRIMQYALRLEQVPPSAAITTGDGTEGSGQ
ncbi:MAG: penicillin-binding transpeptidase domain-containing protein [Acidimicrobiia bacterium]